MGEWVMCSVCGAEFEVPKSQIGKRVTCSRACRDVRHKQRIVDGEIAVGYAAWSDVTKAEMAASKEVRESLQLERAHQVEVRRQLREAKAFANAKKAAKKAEYEAKQRVEMARQNAYLRWIGEIKEGETDGQYTRRILANMHEWLVREERYIRAGLLPMPKDWKPEPVEE